MLLQLMESKLPKLPKSLSGFTLIELMIAITIVAVLSVLSLTIFSGLQRAGRDTRRREEITAISNAIESQKDPGSGEYIFTTSDLHNEFSASSNPYSGLDPSGSPYCVYSWNSVQLTTPTPPATALTPCSSPAVTGATLQTLATAVTSGAGDVFNNSTPSTYSREWILCASLENSSVPFCKVSQSGF